MAIDYVVDYACAPKLRFGTEEILDRLKGRVRAETIIRLFRQHGDSRPASEMGFEFVRNTAQGEEETQIIIVQDLLDRATELDETASACVGCPANETGKPFGCFGGIQYPLSAAGESWLMARLPGIEQPLLWLLLRQGIQEMGYDGSSVQPLRASGTYFELSSALERDMQDFRINSDQVFEMIFLLGNIAPAHAGILLQFFDIVPRVTEAGEVVEIMNQRLNETDIEARYPLQVATDKDEDTTIADLKLFFGALHRAWRLNVPLILDV
jgi:hypothetical protein